jgi:hypothetical protein
MALRDPVAVFNADTNVEAQLVRTLLVDAGIEAFVVEDVSYVGTYSLGTLPEINKPQVWVERANAAKAWEFLDGYERRAGEQEKAVTDDRFCYHCGEQVQRGDSTCAACGRSLARPNDAQQNGNDDEPTAGVATSGEEEADDHVQQAGLAGFRKFKKPLAWLFLACLAGPLLLAILGAVLEFVARLAGGTH